MAVRFRTAAFCRLAVRTFAFCTRALCRLAVRTFAFRTRALWREMALFVRVCDTDLVAGRRADGAEIDRCVLTGRPTACAALCVAGFATCPARAAFFFGAVFFSFSAPSATDASARLQIKTRNILMSFFILRYWTLRCPDLFNVGLMSSGCLTRYCRSSLHASALLSHGFEQHNCHCGRQIQAPGSVHWNCDTTVDVGCE
jgi:hypothetical protein